MEWNPKDDTRPLGTAPKPTLSSGYRPPPEAGRPPEPKPVLPPTRPRRRGLGCLLLLVLLIAVPVLYLLLPGSSNLLLLGVDSRREKDPAGRTDTMMLMRFSASEPFVGVLSLPRDLYLPIPGGGMNRLNTVHRFAELERAGSGPQATADTVTHNFGVEVDYFVRLYHNDVEAFIDALGGLPIVLEKPEGIFEAGSHLLSGKQALRFVRQRKDSSDITRMQRGQFFLRALLTHVMRPQTWPKLPGAAQVILNAFDSNIPAWEWPRMALALLRVGPQGIESAVIDWTMVSPRTTEAGAAVLEPRWDKIQPLIEEIFGPR